MGGRTLADALRRFDTAEELGHVLLVQEVAVFGARLCLDHERRPVRTPEQRDRCGMRDDCHSGLEGMMQKDVLLVVHDPPTLVLGCDGLRCGCDRLPNRHDREHRTAGNVVGSGGVAQTCIVRHGVAMLCAPGPDGVEPEAHDVIPVV